MGENNEMFNKLVNMGFDIPLLMQEAFIGYKYRRNNKKLSFSDDNIPTNLIKIYYSLNNDEIIFDKMKKAFVSNYILNESKLEGVNDEDIHGKEEILGFKKMYEYIHSDSIDYMFNVFTLKELHKELFSCTEHPECAGNFRNMDVYLPGTGTELAEWSMIYTRLNDLDRKVQFLYQTAHELKNSDNVDALLSYLDQIVELKCDLIKVHPFFDGNGRAIRGFINKLLEDAGFPPIYIKARERTEYHKAMNLANNEGDYKEIKNFYRYKICDSIVELDINNRLKEENRNKRNSKVKKKYK